MCIEKYRGQAPLEVKEIQRISFEILKYINGICEENNIRYVLAYGSVLGAVRHKGFIPWDDDLDIAIMEEDIDRFYSAIVADNNPRFKLLLPYRDAEYKHPYAKVVDTNTIRFEPSNDTVKNLGVFVDIFMIVHINQDLAMRSLPTIMRRFKRYNYKYIRNGKNSTVVKSAVARFFRFMYRHSDGEKELMRLYEMVKNLSANPDSFWIADSELIFPDDVILPFTYGVFEGMDVPLPFDVDRYCRMLYGDDYMTPIKTEYANHGETYYRNV